MLFNSAVFIFIFLPTVLLVFYALGYIGRIRLAIGWLVAASLFFYGWWNPAYLVLILASIVFNYLVGRALGREGGPKKGTLFFGVAVNLSLLAYYKYANFFVENVNSLAGTQWDLGTIILPLAISFFTFQQITYLVDSSRGLTREYHFLNYCLFVTFFPQLIAGPIVHHGEMLPQFYESKTFRFLRENFATGLTIFLLGLFKKTVLADGAAVYATPVFDAAEAGQVLTFFEAWAGALGYTFQLYFDFSGYSDMAIGIARMFNIVLPLNFFSPYKALNIVDFWRRWHITLSRFLRDYLYIPLGGNRKGPARRYVNLFTTMLLGGLWHGAGWTFVAWGALHGGYLMVNHAWQHATRSITPKGRISVMMVHASAWLITMLAVIVAWVFFRALSFDGALRVLGGMSGVNGFVLPAQLVQIIPGLSSFVDSVGTMKLLGGGSIMGVFEMLGLYSLLGVLVFMPAMHEMSTRLRTVALALSFYFTIQAVLFTREASEFLYFQF
jgi:D-alanyl-lipoteichoic acid acyltransferase DltB (MBOAT superfamily)